MRVQLYLASVLIWSGVAVTPLYAADTPHFSSHRAVYDLVLDNASDKSGISGLNGRMVYEFNGSPCEGYTTRFRFVTRIESSEMPVRVSDQQTTSFESADGREFKFVSKTYMDQELTQEVDGSASQDGKVIKVHITKPHEKDVELKKADFPTMQTFNIVRNALGGKHFMHSVLYDGSDTAEKLSETTVVLGALKRPEGSAEEKAMGEVGKASFWPVTISYFDDETNPDGLPTYRTSFKLYENGVTRDLVMDYGDFSVRGKLVSLELFKPDKTAKTCQAK